MRVDDDTAIKLIAAQFRAADAQGKLNLTVSTFAGLGLSEPLLRALPEANYNKPTPVQVMATPELLDGADLQGVAQTRTGKTAAFIPAVLDNLKEEDGRPRPKRPRALILSPVRKLIIQISESIKTYGRHIRSCEAAVEGPRQ